MKRLPILIVTLTLTLWSPLHAAPVETFQFDDPVKEETFKRLSHQLRCLVCQNQTLADSNADLASDLRRQVYEMVQRGASEQEIVDYMVARYGDFVLYKPPLKTKTYLLWFGPFILLAIALAVVIVLVRRSGGARSTPLSAQDRDRLNSLMDEPEDRRDSQ